MPQTFGVAYLTTEKDGLQAPRTTIYRRLKLRSWHVPHDHLKSEEGKTFFDLSPRQGRESMFAVSSLKKKDAGKKKRSWEVGTLTQYSNALTTHKISARVFARLTRTRMPLQVKHFSSFRKS